VYLDGRRIPNGATLDAGVCIVGGGPAGITVAHELLSASVSTIVVESGGWRPNSLVQALNDAEVSPESAHPPAEMYRERRFGGSSTIWGGRCVPLRRSDFELRSHVTNSGWPLRYDDLLPYYAKAMSYCEAGQFAFDPASLRDSEPIIGGLKNEQIVVGVERFSPPTDFGRRYKPDFARAPTHTILLESTCVCLLSNDEGSSIEAIECVTLAGNRFKIRARCFVVAAGALESVRLLAASNRKCAAGIGNSSGLLGRYYMSHLEGTLGRLQVATGRHVAWNFAKTSDGIYAKHYVRLSDDVQQVHRLRNIIFRLHHPNPMDPDHGDPVLSLMYLAKRFILPEYRRKITTVELDALKRLPGGSKLAARHAANVVRRPWPLIRFLSTWTYRRYARYRRVPYVALYSKAGVYPLDYNAEQTPLQNSRVFLVRDKDRFGVPKLRIEWQVCAEDIESIAASYRLMQQALAPTGAAILAVDHDDLTEKVRDTIPVGGHHLGIARMSDDPRRGVVDPQCRTHDIENLYLASSAVFPTSGAANPTLTIVALAIRVADRLKAALAGKP
jgi:choline dehydrogenase-like flavoprotein